MNFSFGFKIFKFKSFSTRKPPEKKIRSEGVKIGFDSNRFEKAYFKAQFLKTPKPLPLVNPLIFTSEPGVPSPGSSPFDRCWAMFEKAGGKEKRQWAKSSVAFSPFYPASFFCRPRRHTTATRRAILSEFLRARVTERLPLFPTFFARSRTLFLRQSFRS